MGLNSISTSKKITDLYNELFKNFGQSNNLMVCSSGGWAYVKFGDVFIPVTNDGMYSLCLDTRKPDSHFFENTPSIKTETIEEMVATLDRLGYKIPTFTAPPVTDNNEKYRQIPLSTFDISLNDT